MSAAASADTPAAEATANLKANEATPPATPEEEKAEPSTKEKVCKFLDSNSFLLGAVFVILLAAAAPDARCDNERSRRTLHS